jgi:hypothetical protein
VRDRVGVRLIPLEVEFFYFNLQLTDSYPWKWLRSHVLQ